MRRLTSAIALSLLAGPAFSAPGTIVADIPATGSLVQQVLGDLGQVRVLLPDGASVHHYQMRPSDAQALQATDLLVWVGPDLTPWLARAVGNLNASAAQLPLLEVAGTHLQPYGPPTEAHAEDDHHDEHEHEHGHDHGDDHGHEARHDAAEDDDHAHDHTGTDPHAWLDPQNGRLWLTAIADALAAQDPENAETYRANAEAASARTAALEEELRAQLAPHADARFVVFHDAYGYFTNRFGLSPAIPVALGDASTPSAARIQQIRAEIAQTGALCAFPEYAHDEALVGTVVEGSEVRLGGVIDPQGSMQGAGAEQYEAMLRSMGETIATCLAGN